MTIREQGVPGEHEEATGEEGERPAGGQQGAAGEHQEESCRDEGGDRGAWEGVRPDDGEDGLRSNMNRNYLLIK